MWLPVGESVLSPSSGSWQPMATKRAFMTNLPPGAGLRTKTHLVSTSLAATSRMILSNYVCEITFAARNWIQVCHSLLIASFISTCS